MSFVQILLTYFEFKTPKHLDAFGHFIIASIPHSKKNELFNFNRLKLFLQVIKVNSSI